MHILIIDHSVIAYKAFMRLYSQDYEGETDDEMWEFSSQYVAEIQYLMELHKPDGVVWVMDCPREEIWRHRVTRKYYGERAKVFAVEWMPALGEVKTADNACRWNVECDNTYKAVWKDADGNYKSKAMTKSNYSAWAKELSEAGTEPPQVTDKKIIRDMLPHIGKMYKGNRASAHFPQSAVMDKEMFKSVGRKLAYQVAPIFGGRIVEADKLEADDLAYAAVKRWYKHNITVATIDKDWLQLGLHMSKFMSTVKDGVPAWKTRKCGEFKFWDTSAYDYLDTENVRLRKLYAEKILTGDDSDHIASCRLAGKTGGIGPKACDKIFDEVSDYSLFSWLEKNVDTATLMRNVELINLARIPKDLAEVADKALLDSAKIPKPEVKLTDLASEVTINMAKIEGQKARLLHRSKKHAPKT